MRPKSFGKKPSKTSPERLKRTARATKNIYNAVSGIKGTKAERAEQVAALIIRKIPFEGANATTHKKTIFRKSAEQSLEPLNRAGALHCSERSNAAIALLNAAGINAWLVREIKYYTREDLSDKRKEWYFHDFVEMEIGGRLKTLMFHTAQPVIDSYIIEDGPADRIFRGDHSYAMRAADSKQIGGIANWAEFKKYAKSFTKNMQQQIEKNERRTELLIKEGIIPKTLAQRVKAANRRNRTMRQKFLKMSS